MVFNRDLSSSFKDGKNYQNARRNHPLELFDEIISQTHIAKNSMILDVGCGTGKSTIPFAKNGFKIIGIDQSKEMLSVAQEQITKDLDMKFILSSFEDMQFPEKSFDLITFGQSIHWIEPKSAYIKIHSLLKPLSHLAIYFALYRWQDHPLLSQLKELFTQECPAFPVDLHKTKENTLNHLDESGLFNKPSIKKIPLVEKYSQEQLNSLLLSFSWVSSLSEQKKQSLFEKIYNIQLKFAQPFTIESEYTLIIAQSKLIKPQSLSLLPIP